MSATQRCSDCLYYVIEEGLCRRYPNYARRGEGSWCGEFKADSIGNADRLDGRTEDERMEERTKTEQNGAGITEELRKWAEGDALRAGMSLRAAREQVLAIADRIDWRFTDEWEDILDECEEDDLKAFEATHIKLPVDADGVPIRVGDSIEIIGGEEGTVVAIELCEGGWNVSMRPTGWDTPTLFDAESVRHVQPDSWERIITDAMAEAQEHYGDADLMAELVERCRRLAGEAE